MQVYARDEKNGERLAQKLCDETKKYTKKVIGPTVASISKIKDVYRFGFYVKDKDYNVLTQVKDALEKHVEGLNLKTEAVYFDFDPMNTF